MTSFCCTDSMRSVEATDIPSNTLWIVAFSITMTIHIIFISVMLIGRRYDNYGFGLLLM